MEFNPSKCEHLSITNKCSYIHFDYQLCGHTIQKTVNVRYLGVIFDQYLTWKKLILIEYVAKPTQPKPFFKEILATALS